MSPRFERRPEKRSAPSPGWRRSGAARRDAPGRDPVGREGPYREGGGRTSGGRSAAGRSEGRLDGRFERRPGEGRRPQGRRLERPSFQRASFDRPSEEGGRPQRAGGGAGRWDGARGPRRLVAPRPERSGRPPRLAPPAAAVAELPQGESERFGQEPADDLVWGRHPAQAVLESGRPIHRIWCTPEMRFSPRFLQLLREAKASGVLVEEVTWARLGQISGGAVHQGIVLQTAAAESHDLATLVEACRCLSEPPLLLAVDGLTDPHNLGAIVRSGESLGAHGLVLPQRRNAGLTGTVAKVAAGALEHLPVARVVNLNRSLETLRQEGYRIIGLAEEGSVGLHEADLEGPLVVVTGSEGGGLSLLTRRHCDQLVRIPLRGTTPSLNASVATALLLYEIARRGWMKGVRGTAPAPRLERPLLPAPPRPAMAGPEPEHPPVSVPEPLAVPSGGDDPIPVAAPTGESDASEPLLEPSPEPLPAAALASSSCFDADVSL